MWRAHLVLARIARFHALRRFSGFGGWRGRDGHEKEGETHKMNGTHGEAVGVSGNKD